MSKEEPTTPVPNRLDKLIKECRECDDRVDRWTATNTDRRAAAKARNDLSDAWDYTYRTHPDPHHDSDADGISITMVAAEHMMHSAEEMHKNAERLHTDAVRLRARCKRWLDADTHKDTANKEGLAAYGRCDLTAGARLLSEDASNIRIVATDISKRAARIIAFAPWVLKTPPTDIYNEATVIWAEKKKVKDSCCTTTIKKE